MKISKRFTYIHAAIVAIILMSFALGIYYYPQMSAKMASHWNAAGEVDGYMTKFWGLFLMPIITVVMYLMFLMIPKIDPLKKNIAKFRIWFDWFVLMIIIFFFYIYILSLLFNLGHTFNMTYAMLPALGVLFIFIGQMLEHAERNWFIGIRTPWTLSSDTVWKKTHMLGGKLFKAAGVLIFLTIALGKFAFWIVIFAALWAGLYPVVYSYFEYQKLKK